VTDSKMDFTGAGRSQASGVGFSGMRPRALAIAVALALGAGPAGAATFTVTSAGDAGAGTLREAVSVANQTPGPDTIEFAPGLGDIVLQSEIEILEALDIVGPSGQQSIRGSGSARLLAVRTSGAVVTLENLFLANGRSTGPGGGACQAYAIPRGTIASYGDGGAVCSIADITLVGTTITGSSISGDYISGGGLFSSGSVTLVGSTVSNNATDGEFSRGGGIFSGGGLVMNDSIVSGNSTAGGNANGGGIWIGDDAQIVNSVISGNATTGDFANGGGLTGPGMLLLEDSSVVGNSTSGADAQGGGLQLSSTSQLVNTTISGNSTAAVDAPGGGVFVLGTNLAIVNSTITENTSQAGAGGVESRAQENLAYAVVLESTILSGNAGPEGNFRALPGSGTIIIDAVDSLFGDAASEITDTNVGNIFTGAPGLGLLGDNGCGNQAGAESANLCVPTHLPDPGSPAIDAGSNSSSLTFDQRGSGFPRTVGNATDIGAVEAGLLLPPPPPPPPLPVDLAVEKSDGNVVTASGESLAWKITFANLGELVGENVALIETVPEYTEFDPALSGNWVCDNAGAAGDLCRFPIGTLAGGAEGMVDFAVKVDVVADAQEIVNRVEIVGDDGDPLDPDPDNNIALVRTPLSKIGKAVLPERGAVQRELITFFGDPVSAVPPRLGAAGASIGDYNGDGLADVAVSAPGFDQVLLVYGRPFTDMALPLSALPSPGVSEFLIEASDGFGGLGDLLAGVGDVNGDGLDGIAFTNSTIALNPLTGPQRAAYLQPGFDQPPAFVVDQGGRFAPQDGLELRSEQAAGPFATSLAGLGDISGDGLDDFALAFSSGRPPNDVDTVFVLPGDVDLAAFDPSTIVVENVADANGLRLINSGSGQSRFGASIGGIGDFNGDGVEDFAVGAPGQANGAVFVIFGSASLVESSEGFIATEGLDGTNGFAILGDASSSAFGARVAAAGDFDGDGLDDLIVSERRSSDEPGRAHIVFGTTSSLPPTTSPGASDLLRSSRLAGVARGDMFGLSSAGLGDLDGDGFDDLALGMPGLAEAFDGQSPIAGTGRVLVLFGTDALPAESPVAGLDPAQGYWLTAPAPGIGFGSAVAGPGDFDGDGVPDVLVTAPNARFGDVPRAGQFWVISGRLLPEPTGVAVEISGFGISPSSLFAGDPAVISWASTPDDDETICAGSGLPGTAWNGTGKPASGSLQIDTSALAPGSYLPTLSCTRGSDTAESVIELEVLQPPVMVEISEFNVSPDSLFVGNPAVISWASTPDDDETICAGSGLPGTAWNGAGKPASGSLQIDTSALDPDSYQPMLTCIRGSDTAESAAELEVIQPPVELALEGSRTALQFFGDVFVEVELSNISGIEADTIDLALATPPGYEALAVFRLAGDCSTSGSGDLACDAASIPPWQCGPVSAEFSCSLAALPPGGTAGVVLQLRGSGPGQVQGSADAVNALPASIQIALEE